MLKQIINNEYSDNPFIVSVYLYLNGLSEYRVIEDIGRIILRFYKRSEEGFYLNGNLKEVTLRDSHYLCDIEDEKLLLEIKIDIDCEKNFLLKMGRLRSLSNLKVQIGRSRK